MDAFDFKWREYEFCIYFGPFGSVRILLWLVSGDLWSHRGSAINVSAFAIRVWHRWSKLKRLKFIFASAARRDDLKAVKNGKMHCVVTLTQIPRSRRVRNLWHTRDKRRRASILIFDTSIRITCEPVGVCKVRTNAGNNNITKSTTINRTKNSKCGFPSAIACTRSNRKEKFITIKYECACVEDWDRSRHRKCNLP